MITCAVWMGDQQERSESGERVTLEITRRLAGEAAGTDHPFGEFFDQGTGAAAQASAGVAFFDIVLRVLRRTRL